jgi:penicillin V acylase-like amidase (Ntn superfamily)
MRNSAQPFRVADPEKPYASQTRWRTLADLTNGVYVFESATRPNIVWARMSGLDPSEGAPTLKLDLVADTGLEGGLAGDVTDRFVEVSPMQFPA